MGTSHGASQCTWLQPVPALQITLLVCEVYFESVLIITADDLKLLDLIIKVFVPEILSYITEIGIVSS